LEAKPDIPVIFKLRDGREIHVVKTSESDTVTIRAMGPLCGNLLVNPRSGNSVDVTCSGRGLKPKKPEPLKCPDCKHPLEYVAGLLGSPTGWECLKCGFENLS